MFSCYLIDFPLNLLKLAVSKSFHDDPVETPLMFDSQLDFWEFHYWEELEKYGQVDWHLSK
jgi:hypothetical protein